MSWWVKLRNTVEHVAPRVIASIYGGPAAGMAAGVLADKLAGKPNAPGGAATGSTTSGGGATDPNAAPSSVADPFSGQRAQYQTQLQDLMKTNTGVGYGNANQIQTLAGSIGNTPSMQRLQEMIQPGFQYSPNDPSYQFRYQQGLDATTRQAAASGMGRSGNVMAELEKYGQGMASQEYGNEFQRLLNMNTQQTQAQQSQLSALSGIDTNTANLYQNAYQRLATLSGATIGSPGTAASLLQNQQAGAAAGTQQLIGLGASALKDWFSSSSVASSGASSIAQSTYNPGIQTLPWVDSGTTNVGQDVIDGLSNIFE